MDVPAPFAGTVAELKVSVGDKVSEGSLLLTLDGRRRTGRSRRVSRRRRPPLRPTEAGAGQAHGDQGRDPRPRRPPTAAPSARCRPRRRPRRRTPRGRRRRTRARRCGGWRASSASTCRAVAGTGRKGRITKEDVEKAAAAPAAAPAPAAGGACGRRPGPRAVAVGQLREVRPGRAAAAVADPEDQRAEPRPQLGDDPARHPPRRGGHHRARGVPQALNAEHAKQGVKVTMVALLVKAVGRGAEGVPGVQRVAGRRRPGAQALLPPRLRGRHARAASWSR